MGDNIKNVGRPGGRMSRQQAIRDLKTIVKQLESKKREIDKKVEAIHIAIRHMESIKGE